MTRRHKEYKQQKQLPDDTRNTNKNNDQMTQGIKLFCRKRRLYTFTTNSNFPKTKEPYIQYCRILKEVIKAAKKQHCSRLIGQF